MGWSLVPGFWPVTQSLWPTPWRILAAMRIPAREGAATTRALVQANTPPLLMNADPAEGLCVTRSRGARFRSGEDC